MKQTCWAIILTISFLPSASFGACIPTVDIETADSLQNDEKHTTLHTLFWMPNMKKGMRLLIESREQSAFFTLMDCYDLSQRPSIMNIDDWTGVECDLLGSSMLPVNVETINKFQTTLEESIKDIIGESNDGLLRTKEVLSILFPEALLIPFALYFTRKLPPEDIKSEGKNTASSSKQKNKFKSLLDRLKTPLSKSMTFKKFRPKAIIRLGQLTSYWLLLLVVYDFLFPEKPGEVMEDFLETIKEENLLTSNYDIFKILREDTQGNNTDHMVFRRQRDHMFSNYHIYDSILDAVRNTYRNTEQEVCTTN